MVGRNRGQEDPKEEVETVKTLTVNEGTFSVGSEWYPLDLDGKIETG